jgi:hypothetical protein
MPKSVNIELVCDYCGAKSRLPGDRQPSEQELKEAQSWIQVVFGDASEVKYFERGSCAINAIKLRSPIFVPAEEAPGDGA